MSLFQVLLDPLSCFFVDRLTLRPVVASPNFVPLSTGWDLLSQISSLFCHTVRGLVHCRLLIVCLAFLFGKDLEAVQRVGKVSSDRFVTDRGYR